MTTSIELILSNTIKALQLVGWQCSARIGENFILSRNAADDFPLFLFEIRSDNPNVDDYSQTFNIAFLLVFRSTNDDLEMQKFHELRDLYMAFFNELKIQGHDIMEITAATRQPFYFDFLVLETKSKGFRCEMTITHQATKRC